MNRTKLRARLELLLDLLATNAPDEAIAAEVVLLVGVVEEAERARRLMEPEVARDK